MVQTIQLILTIEVETDESKSVIEERINSVDTETLKTPFEETLDEFGEILSIEI